MCETLVLLQSSDSDRDDGMEFTHDEARVLVDTWVQVLDRQHKRQMLIFLICQLLQVGMGKQAAYQQEAKAFHMPISTVKNIKHFHRSNITKAFKPLTCNTFRFHML